jgi:hypothetical protein
MDLLRHHVLLVMMPVFFLSTGLRTNWDVGGAAVFVAAALLLVVSVAGKLIGVRIAGRILNWAPGEAGIIGWLLQTKALIMIIFANILLDKQIITSETFTALLLMAVASTMLTVPIVAPRLARMKRRARHWPCRRRKRRSSNRSPPSCAGSLVLSRCAARIAVVSFWLLPHSCRRPEPGDRRETARQTRASGINEEWPGHSRQLAPGVWPDRVRSVRQRPSGTFTPVQSGACHCHKARNSPIRQPASCHSLDFGQAPLTIPITSARPALQSNEVYPPI